MRTLLVAAVCLLAAAPVAAQHDHPAGAPAGAGQLPAGWHARTDKADQNAGAIAFMAHGEGYHVKTGPAAILWNPAQTASGSYELSATFTAKEQSPREAYGLVFGGRDLDAAGVDYGYFIIRGDGSFMIRHRAGTEVHTLQDWTRHEAVQTAGTDGPMSNTLTVVAGGEQTRFLVNGTEVATLPRQLNTAGIVGLRVNHNLELQVTGLRVSGK